MLSKLKGQYLIMAGSVIMMLVTLFVIVKQGVLDKHMDSKPFLVFMVACAAILIMSIIALIISRQTHHGIQQILLGAISFLIAIFFYLSTCSLINLPILVGASLVILGGILNHQYSGDEYDDEEEYYEDEEEDEDDEYYY